jgi:hypothetical protein
MLLLSRNRISNRGIGMAWELIGHCSVDSGQIMLCDPCYIESHWKHEDFNGVVKKGLSTLPFSYDGACNATLGDKSYGELDNGLGVALTSGFGDGSYPVYAKRSKDGYIVEARIVFDS